MEEIFSKFGLVIINRFGSGPEKIIYENDFLYKHKVDFKIYKKYNNSF